MNRLEKQRREKEKAQLIVDKFNKQYPVGSLCPIRKMAISSSAYEEREVTKEAFVSMSNEPVAYFNGLSGFYSVNSEFIKY